MASNVVSRGASSGIDDDLAALKEELALAKRRRLSGQRAGASADVHSQASGSLTPPGAAQPDLGQNPQAPTQSQDEEQQKALIHLARTLRATDREFFDKFVEIVTDGRDRDFRKNLIASIVLSTIFLIAGWLLSIVTTPATLTTLFHH